MGDSILTSIKHLLGIPADVTDFDSDIIIHINSVIDVLYQLGYGDGTFYVHNAEDIWSEYIQDASQLNLIKTLVYLRVKMLFDPPTSSAALTSFEKLIGEFEFRVNMMVDRDEKSEEGKDV